MGDIPDIQAQKAALRAAAQRRREAQVDREGPSRRICEHIAAMPEFLAARVVLVYIDHSSEVQTGSLIEPIFQQGKTAVVPYCVGDDLRLFRLESTVELSPGAYDILEPRPSLRELPDRRVAPEEVDLVVVPGVAFDVQGRRLGHGKGYYDRLLGRVRPDVLLVAPAFECQIFDEIPTLPHDVRVHRIVTETSVYPK